MTTSDHRRRHIPNGFPRAIDRRSPPGQDRWLDMEEEVRRQAKVRREFLQVHPHFYLRGKIEAELAYLELVLGDYDRAYTALKSVETEGGHQSDWAKGMAEAMESRHLVRPRED